MYCSIQCVWSKRLGMINRGCGESVLLFSHDRAAVMCGRVPIHSSPTLCVCVSGVVNLKWLSSGNTTTTHYTATVDWEEKSPSRAVRVGIKYIYSNTQYKNEYNTRRRSRLGSGGRRGWKWVALIVHHCGTARIIPLTADIRIQTVAVKFSCPTSSFFFCLPSSPSSLGKRR